MAIDQQTPADQTPTDLRYALAQDEGLPPYVWIPPKTLPLARTNNERLRIAEGAKYWADAERAQAIERLDKACVDIEKKSSETQPGEEQLHAPNQPLQKIPHPFSDFTHTHPKNFPSQAPDFSGLKSRFDLHNPQDKKLLDDLDNLDLMLKEVGPQSAAFQRLQMAYDWILCHPYKLLFDLNNAATGKGDYLKARTAYLDFIRNLDNHEPQERKDEVNPAKCLGYGKVIKWVYIDPIVQAHPTLPGVNVITGATIVLEWNPHSSSSGIPIPHNP